MTIDEKIPSYVPAEQVYATRVHDDVKMCKNVTESYVKNKRMKADVKLTACKVHLDKMTKMASYCPETDTLNLPVLQECIQKIQEEISALTTKIEQEAQEEKVTVVEEVKVENTEEQTTVVTHPYKQLKDRVDRMERQIDQLFKIVGSMRR